MPPIDNNTIYQVEVSSMENEGHHLIKFALKEFGIDDNNRAFVPVSADMAEQLGVNLIRMALITRMNNGEKPLGVTFEPPPPDHIG